MQRQGEGCSPEHLLDEVCSSFLGTDNAAPAVHRSSHLVTRLFPCEERYDPGGTWDSHDSAEARERPLSTIPHIRVLVTRAQSASGADEIAAGVALYLDPAWARSLRRGAGPPRRRGAPPPGRRAEGRLRVSGVDPERPDINSGRVILAAGRTLQ